MSEFIQGNCPYCGKSLQIPADLEEFSCLYCGKRCRTELLTVANAVDANSCAQEMDNIREPLFHAIVNYPDYHKKITKKDFFPAFETYEADNGQLLDRIDACARTAPDGKQACIKKLSTALIDDLEAHFKSDPKWEKKSHREQLFFNARVVFAIFLTPLARKRKLLTADIFCEALNRAWLERFPAQKWTPGDYEVLANGFKKRKLCFITTATCLHEGKSDTCDELQAFRAFRDGYLMQHGGREDIAKYYDLAPTIVTCIEHLDDSELVYAEIRQKWLDPCYTALTENRHADCRRLYTDMVSTLRNKYLQ